MKQVLVFVISMLMSVTLYAQEKNALVIKLTNGNSYTFILAQKPVITLSDGNVVVNGSASTTYTRSEVEKFYFVYDDGSGIETIGKNSIMFKYMDGANVRISGLKENTSVSVVTLSGKMISTQKCNGTGTVTIPLENMAKGIYIVSFGDRSVKIRK